VILYGVEPNWFGQTPGRDDAARKSRGPGAPVAAAQMLGACWRQTLSRLCRSGSSSEGVIVFLWWCGASLFRPLQAPPVAAHRLSADSPQGLRRALAGKGSEGSPPIHRSGLPPLPDTGRRLLALRRCIFMIKLAK
jgi:hypothetical protein